MAEIVLIHGSCFDGRAWDALAPHLRDLGHLVCAIDLPGRGGAETTLAQQGQAVAAAITGKALLVGHSAGGYPITMAAELAPERVAGLIYLAGYVPRAGASVADLRRAGPAQPMKGSFRLSADRRAYAFDPAAAREMFFHDCPDPAGLTEGLGLEATAPQETAFGPLTHSPHLPRAAIIATRDRAIPPDWQRQMAGGIAQHDIPTGHCPHLVSPVSLAQLIGRILDGWHKDAS